MFENADKQAEAAQYYSRIASGLHRVWVLQVGLPAVDEGLSASTDNSTRPRHLYNLGYTRIPVFQTDTEFFRYFVGY